MAEKESILGSDALYDLQRSKNVAGHLDDDWEKFWESQRSREDSYIKQAVSLLLSTAGITNPRERRNENVITEPNECNKPLEGGNTDLPLVSCNAKIITYQRRRKNKNIIEIDDDDTDSDTDPDYVNFLSNLKEHGNAYALEYEGDGSPQSIVYEGECSSDDEREDIEKARLGEKDHKATQKAEVEINEHFHVIPGSKNNRLSGKITERSYEAGQSKRVDAQNRKKNLNLRFVEGDEVADERFTVSKNNVYLYQKNRQSVNHVRGDDKSNRYFIQVGNKGFEEDVTMSKHFGRVQLEKREAINRRTEFKKMIKEENMVNRSNTHVVSFNSEPLYEKSGHVKRNHYPTVNEEAGASRSNLKRVLKEDNVIQKGCKGSEPLEKDSEKNNEETYCDYETSTDVEILDSVEFHKILKRNRRNID